MSITAKLRVGGEQLALVPTLRHLDSAYMRVIPQGNTVPGATTFPFFIEYGDRADLEAALSADPTVADFDVVEWNEGTGIYYISHTEETQLISPIVADVNGFLTDTETTGNEWIVRLLLPDRAALESVWKYACEHDLTIDVLEIYANDDPGGEHSYGLTEAQLASLRTAYERGYFEDPRDVSLDDLAADLGLSSTAMSGRLRRGLRNLLSATIGEREE